MGKMSLFFMFLSVFSAIVLIVLNGAASKGAVLGADSKENEKVTPEVKNEISSQTSPEIKTEVSTQNSASLTTEEESKQESPQHTADITAVQYNEGQNTPTPFPTPTPDIAAQTSSQAVIGGNVSSVTAQVSPSPEPNFQDQKPVSPCPLGYVHFGVPLGCVSEDYVNECNTSGKCYQ